MAAQNSDQDDSTVELAQTLDLEIDFSDAKAISRLDANNLLQASDSKQQFELGGYSWRLWTYKMDSSDKLKLRLESRHSNGNCKLTGSLSILNSDPDQTFTADFSEITSQKTGLPTVDLETIKLSKVTKKQGFLIKKDNRLKLMIRLKIIHSDIPLGWSLFFQEALPLPLSIMISGAMSALGHPTPPPLHASRKHNFQSPDDPNNSKRQRND